MNEPAPSHPRRRRLLIAGGVAALVLTSAAVAWRLTSLRGLPDIGDPFDVASFLNIQVRDDDDNAADLYRRAAEKYHPENGAIATVWSGATGADKRSLLANREALDLWRKGTERADLQFYRPSELSFESNIDMLMPLRRIVQLAGLEGTRLEAEGDYVAAWGWYRAIFLYSRQLGRHGQLTERLHGSAVYAVAATRIMRWASQPEVNAAALRRALDDVRVIYATSTPMSVAVKFEYVCYVDWLERPEGIRQAIASTFKPDGAAPMTRAELAYRHAISVIKREPERSRRLFRVITANWLAFCDRDPNGRPPLHPPHKLVFETNETAPESARVLSPDVCDSWFDSTDYLRWFNPISATVLGAFDREWSTQANLVVHLASQLYLREKGELPESPSDLVGPYLEALPAGLPAIQP
jgi:hypothetical protein